MAFKFSDYHNLGMSVMPLRGKNPLLQWKEYQTRRADVSSVQAWDNTQHNIGVITGHISEILVVDVDGEYPANWPEMPATWTVKTKKGYHYYFYLSPDDDFKNSTRICENVDIRANGGYVVAPPSKHPDGGIYEWVEGLSPRDVQIQEIPDFVRIELEKKHKALYQPPAVTAKPVAVALDLGDDDSKAAYIESAIKGECDLLRSTGQGGRNDQLNKSAFALAGLLPREKVMEILEPIAREIGLGAVEIEKTIKSGCDSATPREVPERSYALPRPEPGYPEADLDDMPPLVKNILERHGRKIESSEIASHLIEGAPGILGEMIRWILETSLFPQPVLALASSIPAAGAIMGHKIKTETDFRTNFFVLGIAESGAGKDHARKCIRKLYDQIGMKDNVMGDPASATGVIAGLKRAKGRGLIQIDEFGRFLESMRGRNAAPHVKGITTNFMHMYNHAGEFYTGQEYADNEANGGRNDIDQPCLGIYATTVPDNFYRNLSSDEAIDGFLSRWLIFETSRFDVDPTFNSGPKDIPEALFAQAKFWADQPTFSGDGDNLATYTMTNPRTVYFDDESRDMWRNSVSDYRAKIKNSKDQVERAFSLRTAEHAAKLALIAHEGEYINAHVMRWALELAGALTRANIENIKSNVASSAYEAELQKVLKIIKRNTDMSKSEITKATQSIDRRKRQDILDTLVEAGDIIEYKKDGDGKKQITFYKVKGD